MEATDQEPTPGDVGASGAEGARCRNCGHSAGPRFCGHCGQEVEERRGPLLPLLGEIASEWLSVDGKLLRSLRALARPGRLTRRYLAGHRAPYLSPFRLYALASLILFSSALNLQTPDASEVNLYIAGELVTEGPATKSRVNYTLFNKESATMRRLGIRWSEKIEVLRSLPPQETFEIIFRGLKRALPTGLIFSLPFLALALKLLYLRSGVLYMDHLVFAVHLQSALFLALAVVWLVAKIAGLGPFPTFFAYAGAGLGVLVGYLPFALRRVYAQGRWITAAKTAALLFGYAELLQWVIGLTMVWVLWRV